MEKNGEIFRQLGEYLWFKNKYEKRQSACDPLEDCICSQGRCIDRRTKKMMTSVGTVDNQVLSTCLSAACLLLDINHT